MVTAMLALLEAIIGALSASFRPRASLVAENPRSPWQNGYAERWVGTLRRELLEHVIVLGERHLLHLVRQHSSYSNEDRPHMSLDGDAPITRAVEPRQTGNVVALPRVDGLHHRYARRAA
jgi:transposase InsO family protein